MIKSQETELYTVYVYSIEFHPMRLMSISIDVFIAPPNSAWKFCGPDLNAATTSEDTNFDPLLET